jgi:hypothetical protein
MLLYYARGFTREGSAWPWSTLQRLLQFRAEEDTPFGKQSLRQSTQTTHHRTKTWKVFPEYAKRSHSARRKKTANLANNHSRRWGRYIPGKCRNNKLCLCLTYALLALSMTFRQKTQLGPKMSRPPGGHSRKFRKRKNESATPSELPISGKAAQEGKKTNRERRQSHQRCPVRPPP